MSDQASKKFIADLKNDPITLHWVSPFDGLEIILKHCTCLQDSSKVTKVENNKKVTYWGDWQLNEGIHFRYIPRLTRISRPASPVDFYEGDIIRVVVRELSIGSAGIGNALEVALVDE